MVASPRTSSSSTSSSSPPPTMKLMLREAAQCTAEDDEAFQDIHKHMYFNTNNLWLRLDRLKEAITTHKGFLPLPMLKNCKTIDPKDSNSTPVVQLETAMGAAIECFPGASAAVTDILGFCSSQIDSSPVCLLAFLFVFFLSYFYSIAGKKMGGRGRGVKFYLFCHFFTYW